MKYRMLLLLPVTLLIITVVSSVFAFQFDRALDDSFLYSNNETDTTVFAGNYFSILGGIGDVVNSVYVEDTNDGILLVLYQDDMLVEEFLFTVKEENQSYDPTIASVQNMSEPMSFDEIYEYLFTFSLAADTTYELSLTYVDDTIDYQMIDIVLIPSSGPEYVRAETLKSLSIGSAIFTVISLITVVAIIRKNN